MHGVSSTSFSDHLGIFILIRSSCNPESWITRRQLPIALPFWVKCALAMMLLNVLYNKEPILFVQTTQSHNLVRFSLSVWLYTLDSICHWTQATSRLSLLWVGWSNSSSLSLRVGVTVWRTVLSACQRVCTSRSGCQCRNLPQYGMNLNQDMVQWHRPAAYTEVPLPCTWISDMVHSGMSTFC